MFTQQQERPGREVEYQYVSRQVSYTLLLHEINSWCFVVEMSVQCRDTWCVCLSSVAKCLSVCV